MRRPPRVGRAPFGAEVLASALTMGPTERAERSAAIRQVAGSRTARDWLDDQVAAWKAAEEANRPKAKRPQALNVMQQ